MVRSFGMTLTQDFRDLFARCKPYVPVFWVIEEVSDDFGFAINVHTSQASITTTVYMSEKKLFHLTIIAGCR